MILTNTRQRKSFMPPTQMQSDCTLPIEIWTIILSFVPQSEEVFAAMVCRDWCAILRQRREERGVACWKTSVGCAVASLDHLHFALDHLGLGNGRSDMWDALLQAVQWGKLDVLIYARKHHLYDHIDHDTFVVGRRHHRIFFRCAVAAAIETENMDVFNFLSHDIITKDGELLNDEWLGLTSSGDMAKIMQKANDIFNQSFPRVDAIILKLQSL